MASVAKRKWTYKGQPKEAWVVRFFDEEGSHKSKQFDKKKDADAFKLKVDNQKSEGGPITAANRHTVREVAEMFLRGEEERRKDGRIGRARYEQLRNAIDISIIPLLGAKVLQNLTRADVEDFYSEMRKKGLVGRTARERVFMLRQVEEYAYRRGMIRTTIVPEASKVFKGIVQQPITTITMDGMKAILSALQARRRWQTPRQHCLAKCTIHLAAFCGLRYGEIMGLTVDNIVFGERPHLQIRHSLTAWDELKGPKTASGNRDVPLPRHVADLLHEWLQHFYQETTRELVFRTVQGTIIVHGNFHGSCWRPTLKQAGLFDPEDILHFHALRHFAASWMIENGLPLTDVAALLGHRKFDMTLQVYAHPVVGGHRRHELFESMAGRLLEAPVDVHQVLLTQRLRTGSHLLEMASE